MKTRKIDRIVIHCSASPEGRADTIEDLRRWHFKRGWRDVGYHYVIHLDGSIHPGREEAQVGAGAKDFNKNSLHICYIGGADKDLKPKDTRTELQHTALVNLLEALLEKYPEAEILGHRDLPGVKKACPSFDAKKEYKFLAPPKRGDVKKKPMKKEKKKFKETLVGKFLLEKAPDLAGDVLKLGGDVLGIDALKNLGEIIDKDPQLSPEDKEHAQALLKMEIQERIENDKQITERWKSDNESGTTASKNVRPHTLYFLLFLIGFVIIGGMFGLELPDYLSYQFWGFVGIIFSAYFGLRSIYDKRKPA